MVDLTSLDAGQEAGSGDAGTSVVSLVQQLKAGKMSKEELFARKDIALQHYAGIVEMEALRNASRSVYQLPRFSVFKCLSRSPFFIQDTRPFNWYPRSLLLVSQVSFAGIPGHF